MVATLGVKPVVKPVPIAAPPQVAPIVTVPPPAPMGIVPQIVVPAQPVFVPPIAQVPPVIPTTTQPTCAQNAPVCFIHKHSKYITATAAALKNEDSNDTTDITIDTDSSGIITNHSPNAIELPDISYSVFLKVLEFLYTDSVGSVSLEVGIHLLIASEQFMLDRLKGLCEDLIRRDISTETVVSILVASHRHHAACLKDIALEYILNNLNDPVIMSGLAELKAEPDLLLEIIRRNTYNQQQQLLLHHQQQQQQASAYGPNYDGNATMSDVAVVNNVVVGQNIVAAVNNGGGRGGAAAAAAAAAPPNNNIVGPFGSNAEWNGRR